MRVKKIISENEDRLRRLKEVEDGYDPITGEGSFSVPRRKVCIHGFPDETMYLPEEMFSYDLVDKVVKLGIKGFIESTGNSFNAGTLADLFLQFNKIRVKCDFEFWAYTTVLIKPKEGGVDIPFRLNYAQRKLLLEEENDRLCGKPIRICLCKARQWGGSTEIQIYMGWIQMVHKVNWNSVIVAHLESTARIIKGMYSKMVRSYPHELVSAIKPLKLAPYEGSQKTSQIAERQCRITIGSAEKPDGLRGEDMCMAHISEYGLWKTTKGKSPQDLMQSVTGSILMAPYTMIAVESTAKGVGNPFHKMFKLAQKGGSTYKAVFVAWFECERYSSPVKDYATFIASLDEYERWLFESFTEITLEALQWRRLKLSEMQGDLWRFKSEYPATPEEAFESSGSRVFPSEHVANMRKRELEPLFTAEIACTLGENRVGIGAIHGVYLYEKKDGNLKVWTKPPEEKIVSNRFVIGVDVGGRSEKSDYSVITVFDRFYMSDPEGVPEVAARWRGHCDHDILAWKAVQLSILYENALLAIESNTLETEKTEGSHGEYIFDEIAACYSRHLYARTSAQDIRDKIPPKWGFQTNKLTKQDLIDGMIAAVREIHYIERDEDAFDEMDTYEIDEKGHYNAKEDCHDDIIMATAIALKVAYDFKRTPRPKPIEKIIPNNIYQSRTTQRGAADF